MNMKYDMVVFDLDGTVIDSVEDIMNALNETLRDFVIPYQYDYEHAKALLGGGALELVRKVFTTIGKDADSPFFDIFCEQYYIRYKENQGKYTLLYPKMDEVITYLIDNGVKVAIFSNKPERVILNSIDSLLDINRLEFVLGHQDGYPAKPDTTAFFERLKTLNIDPNNTRILYVGDSDVDMIFAKNIRADGCGCSYGYRSRKELIENGASYIIDTPIEIIELVK